jgi:hypothetical protein
MSLLVLQRIRSGVAPAPPSGAFFEDDFSSGDLDKTENGFTWGGGNTGYVQVIDTATVGLPVNPSASGKAVEFNFDVNNNAELGFQLVASNGDAGYTTVYLRWYAYYPDGTEGGTVGPEWERTNTSNNKLLRLWDRRFQGDAGRTTAFGASTYGSSSGGAGYSTGDERAFIETGGPGFYSSPGESVPNVTGQQFPFVIGATRGAWTKIEGQFTAPTATPSDWGEGNGVIRMWVDDVLEIETTSGSQSDANVPMRGGYLMGFPNGSYASADTKMYLTDFAVSSTGRV